MRPTDPFGAIVPPAFLEDEGDTFDPDRLIDEDWDAIDWLFMEAPRSSQNDGEIG